MATSLATVCAGDVGRFREDGFVVVRGLLDPAGELERLRRAYESLVDRLGDHFAQAAGDERVPSRAGLPFGDRFAIALGASGGALLDHLDPSLVLRDPGFAYRADLPTAQIPELLGLMTAPALTNALAALIGQEIQASPVYHLQLKLNAPLLELATELGRNIGGDVFAVPMRRFHLEESPWHRDANGLTPDAIESEIVTAWIPLTPVGDRDGPLRAIAGSHRLGMQRPPYPAEWLRNPATFSVVPGDVVFLHSKTIHGSSGVLGPHARWAFSLRYAPLGQPTGRPHLPGFIARSKRNPERVLRDAQLWSQMWDGALRNLARAPWLARNHETMGFEEARILTARWQARARAPHDWLTLAQDGILIARLRDSLRRKLRHHRLARRLNRIVRG